MSDEERPIVLEGAANPGGLLLCETYDKWAARYELVGRAAGAEPWPDPLMSLPVLNPGTVGDQPLPYWQWLLPDGLRLDGSYTVAQIALRTEIYLFTADCLNRDGSDLVWIADSVPQNRGLWEQADSLAEQLEPSLLRLNLFCLGLGGERAGLAALESKMGVGDLELRQADDMVEEDSQAVLDVCSELDAADKEALIGALVED